MSQDEGTMHVVQPGETTTRLAFENGLFWETVWKHSKNASLRKKRTDQNVLLPGDEIFIPAVQAKEESRPTEQRHRFKRKGVPEKLNIRFLDLYDKPFANEKYTLIIDGKELSGKLDGDGWLRAPIPPNARQGEVRIGEMGDKATMHLDLGHLPPISETVGVQARLRNLGYYDGPIDGAESETLLNAVAKFRRKNGMEVNTGIDDEFRDKVKQVHGV